MSYFEREKRSIFGKNDATFPSLNCLNSSKRPFDELKQLISYLGHSRCDLVGLKQTGLRKLQPRPWFALLRLQQSSAPVSCQCVFFFKLNTVWASYVFLTTANPEHVTPPIQPPLPCLPFPLSHANVDLSCEISSRGWRSGGQSGMREGGGWICGGNLHKSAGLMLRVSRAKWRGDSVTPPSALTAITQPHRWPSTPKLHGLAAGRGGRTSGTCQRNWLRRRRREAELLGG